MAKEGIPFVTLPFIGAVLIFSVFKWLIPALVLLILALFFLYFFRDPERTPPEKPDLVVSPADGEVMSVEKLTNPNAQQTFQRISVFMSPLNVHVNRAPMDGKLKSLRYIKGGFLPAYKPESINNNKAILYFERDGGEKFIVEMIAGVLARRVKCYLKEGQQVHRGERIGIIMFGSRVDLYLPLKYKITVKKGDKVYAGLTPVARREE